MKSAVIAGIVGAIAAALLLVLAAGLINFEHGAAAYVLRYQGSRRGLVAILANGDGQSYAEIGTDPTLARPDAFPTREEAAYRAQRPLFGELAWIGSLGDPGRVPIALAVLSAVSAGLAVLALGVVLVRRGISAFFALGLFALPGALTTVYGMTPEFLALAVVTAGLLVWESRTPAQSTLAIAAFSAAGLIREEFLLVPLALIVLAVCKARSVNPRPALVRLSIPFAVYGAWVVFVRLRIGAWPVASRSKRVSLVPVAGLIDALQHSASRNAILLWVAVGVAIVAITTLWGPRDAFRAVTITFAALAVFLGPEVWRRSGDFARVLLPLFAYGSIISGAVVRRWVTEAEARHTLTRSF